MEKLKDVDNNGPKKSMGKFKHWTKEENETFYRLLRKHNKDYKAIADGIGTKSKN